MGTDSVLPEEESSGGAYVFAAGVWRVARENLGNSTALHRPTDVPARSIGGFLFPAIPAGVPTTVIPIAFPLAPAGPSGPERAVEEAEVLVVFFIAGLIWALPWFFSNSRRCCRCWQRCFSRRLGCYFCLGLLANLVLISSMIAAVPHISANDVFFAMVRAISAFTEKVEEVLMKAGILLGVFIVYSFRGQLVRVLGFDSQIVRAELQDFLTCFSMRRFSTVEVSLLKASDLAGGFGKRSLFLRLVLGCNEPQHSRPRDGCDDTMLIRERMQLNYDPEDKTQKLTIMVKQQEVVGAAVAHLAPAAGALVGAAAGMMSGGGPSGGAALGVVAGIGTANSLGPEVARVDLSSDMINRLLHSSTTQRRAEGAAATSTTAPLVPWSEKLFVRVDLVPKGYLWIRIADVPTP